MVASHPSRLSQKTVKEMGRSRIRSQPASGPCSPPSRVKSKTDEPYGAEAGGSARGGSEPPVALRFSSWALTQAGMSTSTPSLALSQGCLSRSPYVGRAVGSLRRLKDTSCQANIVSLCAPIHQECSHATQDAPAGDKVSSLGAECIRECGRLTVDDGLELGERTRERLGRVGVLSNRDFDDGKPKRPDVGRDRIGAELVGVLASDALRLMEWSGHEKGVSELRLVSQRTKQGVRTAMYVSQPMFVFASDFSS